MLRLSLRRKARTLISCAVVPFFLRSTWTRTRRLSIQSVSSAWLADYTDVLFVFHLKPRSNERGRTHRVDARYPQPHVLCFLLLKCEQHLCLSHTCPPVISFSAFPRNSAPKSYRVVPFNMDSPLCRPSRGPRSSSSMLGRTRLAV
jgi:hypothetical protein